MIHICLLGEMFAATEIGSETSMILNALLNILPLLIPAIIIPTVIIWGIRTVLRDRSENVRLRLEVGKLADELEQARKRKVEV